MDRLNNLLQELGVSKVKLSKYLNVSRQMVYNYLDFSSFDEWPKEKKILIFQLLDLKFGTDEEFDNISVDTKYLMEVEKRLNIGINSQKKEDIFEIKGANAETKILFNDMVHLLKDKLEENKNNNRTAIRYLYYMLQSLDNIPEIKYIAAYLAKTSCFIDSEQFDFDEEKQYIFEGILYSALSIYNDGGASKNKVVESRKRFIKKINERKEEKLSRTEQLNSIRLQALKELGYTEVNNNNYEVVIEKITEIELRGV